MCRSQSLQNVEVQTFLRFLLDSSSLTKRETRSSSADLPVLKVATAVLREREAIVGGIVWECNQATVVEWTGKRGVEEVRALVYWEG